MSTIRTSIDTTPDKALFKNQRVRKQRVKVKKEQRGATPNKQRGSNR